MSRRSKSATIYTDGACLNNGRENSRAGIGVHWPGNESNNLSRPLSGRATNQRAEIQAATQGINQARQLGYTDVRIKTDSNYVAQAANSWIPNWERNGYKTCNNTEVVNKQDFQELKQSMSGINVSIEHVPRDNNREADSLAREGARQS